MAQPPAFEPPYDFNNAAVVVPQQLQDTVTDLVATIDVILINLGILQRDDGQLNNGLVTIDSISDSLAVELQDRIEVAMNYAQALSDIDALEAASNLINVTLSQHGTDINSLFSDLVAAKSALIDINAGATPDKPVYEASSIGEIAAVDTVRRNAVLLGGHSWLRKPAADYTEWVTADPGGYVAVPSTHDVNFTWIREFNECRPSFFSAAGGATASAGTDDSPAIDRWIDFCKAVKVGMGFDHGWSYRTTKQHWFGTADAAVTFPYLRMNGATIYAAFNNKPVFNFVGVQNAMLTELGYGVITNATGFEPTCGILQGRPKQLSGVKSSGNLTWGNIKVIGDFTCAGYLNIGGSESNSFAHSMFINNIGMAAGWFATDYFKDTFRLPITGASTLTPGLKFTGGSSGAKATLIGQSDTELFCKTNVDDLSGFNFGDGFTFSDGETITDTSGGTAVISIPNGYHIVGKASPDVDLEEDSTSTFQVIGQGAFFNNTSGSTLFPTVRVDNWNDFVINEANINNSNTSSDLLMISGDGFVRPPPTRGLGCSGVNIRATYLHATHEVSIAIGCPLTTGKQTFNNFQYKDALFAGNVQARVRVSGADALIQDSTFHSNGTLDFGTADVRGNNEFRLLDRSGTPEFICAGVIEGNLYTHSSNTITLPSGDNNNLLKVHYIDTGMSSVRRRKSETIASGAITASAPLILVSSEGGAGTSDNLDTMNLLNGAEVNGQRVGLRAISSTHTITVRTSGNFRSTQGNYVLSHTTYQFYVRDANVGHWIHIAN